MAKVALVSAVVLVAACGAPDETLSPGDRAQIDEQARQVQQALNEPTCGTTAADVTWNTPGSGAPSVSSANGSYDHPTCRNAFIADAPMVRAGTTFTASPLDPPVAANAFVCLFTFVYIGLWRKQGTSYVKVTDTFSLGHATVLTNIGGFCTATPSVKAPADGDYKVVTSAGTFFVGYGPVAIGAS